jgi:hypothetical protein
LLVVLTGALVAGCSGSSGGGGAATTTAPLSSGTAANTTSQTLTAPANGPLTRGVVDAIARTCAPQLRFNAYHNDGNTTKWNRHEDFFPMSVKTFMAELTSRQARVVIHESSGTVPGISEVRPFTENPVFSATFFGPYPRRMAGDAPGSAPLYVHVYDDVTQRQLAPDGSGELTCFVEYWVFYAYDRAEAKLLNIIGGPDVTGHRADWEHTAFRAKVQEAGFYYGHARGFEVLRPELETVDDQGQPDPQGTHPVVYVSQGKHASYPQAGHWRDSSFPTWLAEHIDFFRGNGVIVSGWTVPLIDLEDPATFAAELNPADHQTLVANSPVNPTLLPDWTEFWGRWGPDLTVLPIPTSPTGPKPKKTYGDYGQGLTKWTDAKASSNRLEVYADQGITIPAAATPDPIRR